MKIAMDIREAASLSPTGKGMWSRRVVEELKKRDIEIVQYGESCSKGISWHLKTARLVKKEKPDVYLSPTSFIVPWLIGKKIPTAIVIHDLIAFQNEPHDRKAKFIERILLPKVLKKAKWIFTVSDETKRILIEMFPEVDQKKIITVFEGPTVEEERNERRTSLRQGYGRQGGGEEEYVLSIGTLCPRKNQIRLIKAFNKLPDEIKKQTKLILAGGRGWNDDEIVKLAEESENVEWKGYVPDEELRTLLEGTTLLAYPSLMEGFGLPVLDAMTLGVPVLTSNKSSLPEVAGDAAVLVDPEDISEIANGLIRLLTDNNLRQLLIEKGYKQAEKFSWDRTVDLMIENMCHS
jgi:glycosyltransferase involved in cell wall biosynthesis